jgi:hypothetical protein
LILNALPVKLLPFASLAVQTGSIVLILRSNAKKRSRPIAARLPVVAPHPNPPPLLQMLQNILRRQRASGE